MGGFNGNLGFQGAQQAPQLVQLITAGIDPGPEDTRWVIGLNTQQQQQFQQLNGLGGVGGVGGLGIAGGVLGVAGVAGVAGGGALGVPGVGGVGVAGNVGGIGGLQVAGVPPPPTEIGGQGDPRYDPAIDIYNPALALVVRANTKLHYSEFGGLLSPKKGPVDGDGDFGGFGPDEKGFPRFLVRPGGGKDKKIDPKDIDPKKMWQESIEKGASDPGMIIAAADFLFENKKFEHAAELLKATLRNGIIVRPWVYEALAVALETKRGASPEELQRLRLSALSLEPDDVSGFLRAANTLADQKDYRRAVQFCRQASVIQPNLASPYIAALDYAELGKNIDDMIWAANQLLSQDWPIDNDAIHAKVEAKIESLVRTLEGEKHAKDVQRLKQAVKRTQIRDLVIRVRWEEGKSGVSEIDMEVREPNGSLAAHEHRQTPGGGILLGGDLDSITDMSYIAAKGFSGKYTINLKRLWGTPLGGKVRVEVIKHRGTKDERYQIHTLDVSNPQTLEVELPEGRRENVAVVPPVSSRLRSYAKQKTERQNILTKLRNLTDPYSSSAQRAAMTGGVGTSTNARVLRDLATARFQKKNKGKSSKGKETVLVQSGVRSQGPNSVALTTSTTLSPEKGEVRVKVTPNFENMQWDSPVHLLNLPLIPGNEKDLQERS
ncbi:MAG: hypothetical protein ACFCD0_02575 [Gemmataceae bacterium]